MNYIVYNIIGWEIVFYKLRNRDITRTLDLAENEMKIVIPITLGVNAVYKPGDLQHVTIVVGVDHNITAEVSHNITIIQSGEMVDSAGVPEIANVSLSMYSLYQPCDIPDLFLFHPCWRDSSHQGRSQRVYRAL